MNCTKHSIRFLFFLTLLWAILPLWGMEEMACEKTHTSINPNGLLYQAFTQSIDSLDSKTIEFLCKIPGALQMAGTHGTPLEYAIKKHILAMVKLLVENGADINAPCEEKGVKNFTLLHRAISLKSKEIVKYLLEKGADINHAALYNRKEYTSLDFAVLIGDMPIIKLLVQHNAKITDRSLFETVELGNISLAKFLVAQGANVNATDGAGNTPCHLALIKGNGKMAKFLLNSGARNDADKLAGFTPLYYAAQKGLSSILLRFLSKGAEIDELTSIKQGAIEKAYQDYPLTTAFLKNDEQKAQEILAGGVTPDDMKEALYCAIEKGNKELVFCLLKMKSISLKKTLKFIKKKLKIASPDQQQLYQLLKKQIAYRVSLFEQILCSDALASALRKKGSQSLPLELKECIEKAGYILPA